MWKTNRNKMKLIYNYTYINKNIYMDIYTLYKQ